MKMKTKSGSFRRAAFKLWRLTFSAVVCCASSAAIFAGVGDLDLTFGTAGRTSISINDTSTSAKAMAVQPDGKIIIAGHYSNSVQFDDFALVRFNPDGTPDTTFDGDGKVVTNVSANNDFCRAVALQPDGKIVVVGASNFDGNAFRLILARYNSNGSLDSSFGNNGLVVNSFSTATREEGYALTILPDGKLLVAGLANVSSTSYDMAVFKFNTNGSLDSSFGIGGRAFVPVATGSGRDEARGIAVQPDGKIVIGGFATPSTNNPDFAVVRLNANGTIDTTFGTNGKTITPIGSVEDGAYSVALQPDGKIVLAGYSYNEGFSSTSSDFAVVRYNSNGNLDTGFGAAGKIKVDLSSGKGDEANSVLIQPDGKILVGGFAGVFFDYYALMRFDASGAPDASFGSNGKIVTTWEQNSHKVFSLSLTADNKILAGGIVNGKFGVAKYLNALTRPRQFDFNGDGKDDVAVLRNDASGVPSIFWFAQQNTQNGFSSVKWGLTTDQPAPADFDGDRKTDVAVFRDGTWYILRSSSNSMQTVRFGQTGDRPFPADFDGDGKADPAVFRPSANATGEANWYVLNSGNSAAAGYQFGVDSDVPAPGDYDGDGRAEFAVYRPSLGQWYISRGSSRNFEVANWGQTGDIAVGGDYDGDGKNDFAVFRPGTGQWFVKSASNAHTVYNWGLNTDKPVPADFDGDVKTDPAVFRNGIWYIRQSQNGTMRAETFGNSSDKPVQSVYLP